VAHGKADGSIHVVRIVYVRRCMPAQREFRDGVRGNRPHGCELVSHKEGKIRRVQVNFLTGSRKNADFYHDIPGVVEI
jgi:hypothetical protein